jgi:hypothetical protein
VSLDRGGVDGALSTILAAVPEAEIRLVGTASCVLRGIEIPVADIDILFRDRAGVDAWCAALASAHRVVTTPSWIRNSCQYFARVVVDAVTVELSTVEIETDSTTMECFGVGPWQHFDLVGYRDGVIPAVASELRLVSEVAREREDRWQPIARFLAMTACNRQLVRHGLADRDVHEPVMSRVLTLLETPL